MNPPAVSRPVSRPPRVCAVSVFVVLVGMRLSALAGHVAAQETISSDRPGIGSGPTVISPGILQFEAGVSRSRSEEVDTWSFGQLLVRYGVEARVEVELLLNSVVVQRGPPGSPELDEEGIEDLAFGTKVRVAQSDRAIFSLQGLVTTRSGSSAFSAGEWYGTLYGLLDVARSEAVALSVNAGLRPAVGDLPAGFTANVTPGVSLGGGFGVYGGWAGAFTTSSDLTWFEGGATYLMGSDVQVDVNGAWAVEDRWFFGAGVAFRLGAD